MFAMQKWEYWAESSETSPNSTEILNRLNELGNNGWELVSVVTTSSVGGHSATTLHKVDEYFYFFKKPLA
jgi:hypothetical protein